MVETKCEFSTIVAKIRTNNPDSVLYADASELGWGAMMDDYKIQGEWNEQDKLLHINAKETLAVLFGLQHLAGDVFSTDIHVKSDNTTTVCYINKMGRGVRSLQCSKVGSACGNGVNLERFG